VLDFGGGAGGLSKVIMLHGLTSSYEVVLADVNSAALRIAPRCAPVLGMVQLPFDPSLPLAAGAVDVVVSSDVFEHIPQSARLPWSTELERVARYGQIHTMPCTSNDGQFAAERTDRALQAWHERTFGKADPFTAEHLQNGLPTPDDLRAMFPDGVLTGFANAEVWLKAMKGSLSRPSRFARLVAAFSALPSIGKYDTPPFKNCFVDAITTRR
jgi:hypothetical protein